MSDYNRSIIDEFRANGGRVGGHWNGRDLLLLTTVGRKSGREHTTPAVFTRDGDRLLVYASKGGAPTHPDWYLNLLAEPQVTLEVGPGSLSGDRDAARRRRTRSRVRIQVARNPTFGDYEQRTDRVIPVVALTRGQH